MIRVIDDYAIEAADKCYSVGKVTVQRQKQKDDSYIDVEVIASPAYFPSFEDCLKWLYKRLRLETIKRTDGDLKAALRAIQEADERMNEVLGGMGYKIAKIV